MQVGINFLNGIGEKGGAGGEKWGNWFFQVLDPGLGLFHGSMCWRWIRIYVLASGKKKKKNKVIQKEQNKTKEKYHLLKIVKPEKFAEDHFDPYVLNAQLHLIVRSFLDRHVIVIYSQVQIYLYLQIIRVKDNYGQKSMWLHSDIEEQDGYKKLLARACI